LTYHTGRVLNEDGTDDGTEELGDPVEDAGEDGDLAAEGEAEGNGGVDVAARDVGADGNRDEQSEPMAHRHGDQPGGVKRRATRQLGWNNEQSMDRCSLLVNASPWGVHVRRSIYSLRPRKNRSVPVKLFKV